MVKHDVCKSNKCIYCGTEGVLRCRRPSPGTSGKVRTAARLARADARRHDHDGPPLLAGATKEGGATSVLRGVLDGVARLLASRGAPS